MKKITMLFIALVCFFATTATNAQTRDMQGNWIVGTSTDTAKGATTKTQEVTISDPSKGVTVQYWCHQLTDSISGYASVWCSLDGITYIEYPGADSVAIDIATDTKHMWFLNTHEAGNPIKRIQVRTRCASYSTDDSAAAKLNTKLWQY